MQFKKGFYNVYKSCTENFPVFKDVAAVDIEGHKIGHWKGIFLFQAWYNYNMYFWETQIATHWCQNNLLVIVDLFCP